MTSEPEQLIFNLPHRPASGAEDFVVSGCNELAVRAIDTWPGWQNTTLAIVGPAGSGKSHLVEVWRTRSGGPRFSAGHIDEHTIDAVLARGTVAIEDIDRGINDERVLFHILNLAKEDRISVLLTSQAPPGEIDIALPDLRSRLRALPIVAISAPDDLLLKSLLVKLFADRQLSVEPHIIHHLALYMDRTTKAATDLVAKIDQLSLLKHRRVTRALAAEALRQMQPSAGDRGKDRDEEG